MLQTAPAAAEIPIPAEDEGWRALEASARVLRTPAGTGEMVWRLWGRDDGPHLPLVLLHGGSGSWLHWLRNIEAFAADRLVVVPDIPGLGLSAPLPDGARAEAFGATVAAGLDQVLGETRECDLVGFSFGGVVAGYTMAAREAATRRLVLVGAGGLGVIKNTGKLVRVRDKLGQARAEAHRHNLNAWMIADPDRIDPLAIAIQDWNSRHARLDSRPIGTSDALLPVLKGSRVPLAGIWGALDHSVQGDAGRAGGALREIRPEAPFRVIDGAGHWVAYEAAADFNPLLRETLDREAA